MQVEMSNTKLCVSLDTEDKAVFPFRKKQTVCNNNNRNKAFICKNGVVQRSSQKKICKHSMAMSCDVDSKFSCS
jgi:hypothetical protein